MMKPGRYLLDTGVLDLTTTPVVIDLDDLRPHRTAQESQQIFPCNVCQMETSTSDIVGAATVIWLIQRKATGLTLAGGNFGIAGSTETFNAEWAPIDTSDRLQLSLAVNAGTAKARSLVTLKDF